MDPICHTLVGASLGCTGLEKRARFGRTTLILGANMPDLDAITYYMAPMVSLEWRRGITHGILALLIFPFLLAAFMKLVDYLWPRNADSPECRYKQLVLLSAIAITTHPVLDFLNTYGMRWLMPFVDKWWYGDTLFIIDPWVWSALAIGLAMTFFRRRNNIVEAWRRPAAIALVVVTSYVLLNAAGSMVATRAAKQYLAGENDLRIMSSPIPINPFQRFMVVDNGREYVLGWVDLAGSREFQPYLSPIPIGKDHPAVAIASQDRGAQVFLHWARFPYFVVEERGSDTIVHMLDARYENRRREGFGSFRVVLPGES